ncbi:hypothetical protein G2W53_020254 [Senna tora]|uniref:Uncharacterized protein n=1 Tax=Senna tora TaxID=362788 RepID=A0A834U021_9FABA|nr:hypothetical protein G2W53_020254 [Senna tora]
MDGPTEVHPLIIYIPRRRSDFIVFLLKKDHTSTPDTVFCTPGNHIVLLLDATPVPNLSPWNLSLTAVSPPSFHKPEGSNSDSLPDSSTAGNEYRALRRKYLLLEDESFALGKELREVEDEVKTLEDEKLALLDQLVVLEGLVDPSEMQKGG